MAFAQKVEHRQLHCPVRAERAAARAESLAGGADGFVVSVQAFQVFLSRRSGINEQVAAGFDIAEHDGAVEVERQFRRIEHLEQHDFVTGGGEGGEILFQCFNRSEEVRDQNHQRTFADDFYDPFQWGGQIGGGASGGGFELQHEPAQMADPIARWEVFADLFVEGEQAHSVALLMQKVGERGGEGVGVLRFGPAKRAVIHRAAVVHEQVAAEVGFVLEFLDVVTVAAREEPPVEIARIVTGRILAILGELDGEPVIRTAMNAMPESLDHDAGAEFEVLDGHQGLRRN